MNKHDHERSRKESVSELKNMKTEFDELMEELEEITRISDDPVDCKLPISINYVPKIQEHEMVEIQKLVPALD